MSNTQRQRTGPIPGGGSSYMPAARVYGGGHSVAHNTPTLVEDWVLSPTVADTDVFEIAGTNDEEVRVRSDGLYLVTYYLGWSTANTTGIRTSQLRHLRDVGSPESGNEFSQIGGGTATATVYNEYSVAGAIYAVLEDDYFDLQVTQTSTISLTLGYAGLHIVRLGDLGGFTS